MKQRVKDRLIEWLVIALFLGCLAGAVYFILRVMTKWKVPGLG